MGRSGFLAIAVSALLVVQTGLATAQAQEIMSGTVNAVLFQPIPEGLPILVRPRDDSPENLAIKAQLDQALAKDGFTAATDASALVLSFETRRELGGGPTPNRQITDQFVERQEGSDVGTRRYEPQIGKGSPRGPTSISASRFRLDATLDNKQSGKRLWRGWTIARMKGDETAKLAKVMVPVLVDNLGETVQEQTFEIPVTTASETQTR